MDIWIIKNGEKEGPLRDFDVRGRIEAGELGTETPAWHEGLDGWRPLGELPLFAGEFERLAGGKNVVKAPPPPSVDSGDPSDVQGGAHLVRRFWARWFDLYLFAGVWWFGMWAAGGDVGGILDNAWIILSMYVPWFALEAVLLHRYGTTPGKWLLGIRVVNDRGGLMNLAESCRRAGRVLFLGVGFGWSLLSLICQIMALITTRRIGRPLWDHVGGHRLSTTPLSPLRLVTYVIVLFAALQLQFVVIAPHAMERIKKQYPALGEHFEKNNPPWHLPVRR